MDGTREALRHGAQGWTDECVAFAEWDFHPDVALAVTWWHGRHDANVPLQSVERVAARMPSVELLAWDHAGHLESYLREEELLGDLLGRA